MGTPYVVLSGRARIERDGEVVAERGPGGFFGELAALDWGAGFGYARLATVTAVEPLEMLAARARAPEPADGQRARGR